MARLTSNFTSKFTIDKPEFFFGIGAVIVAIGYRYVAKQIPESMLSDAVGAGGVPNALGWALAILGGLVALRSIKRRASEPPVSATAADDVQPTAALAEPAETTAGWRPHVQALGLLGILIAYVLITPLLGYILSTALLIGISAWFCGTPFSRNLLIIAALGGLSLWIMFDPLLSTPMPVGTLWGGR